MSERHCSEPNCYPETGCVWGEVDRRKCQHWTGGLAAEHAVAELGPPPVAPWTSEAMGTVDLLQLSARRRPTVVGIIGPADAGKTTFLVMVYLGLLNGLNLAGLPFAGSLTLAAWESLAQHMRRFGDYGPGFPPHTTSAARRQPGLLHLALRAPDGGLRDVVFTDAPGEWFARWSVRANGPDCEGARWVSRHADVALLFADCEKLSGKSRGTARGELLQLIDRIATTDRSRHVELLWSKADHVVPDGIRATLLESTRKAIGAHVHGYSVNDRESAIVAASSAVRRAWEREASAALSLPPEGRASFLQYRGAR